MKHRFAAWITLLSASLVLLALVFQQQLGAYLGLLLHWAIILSTMTLLIALVSLMLAHLRKISGQDHGILYSLILVASFLAALAGGLFMGLENQQYLKWIAAIIRPLESSLLALLALVLAGTVVTLFRRRGWSPMSVSFALFTLIFLVIGLGFLQGLQNSTVDRLIAFFQRLPGIGIRGLLIGLGLGALFMGLRFIFGMERPSSD